MFNDETLHSHRADNHWIHVRRKQGQLSQSTFILQKYIVIVLDVVMWISIFHDNRSFLVLLHITLKTQLYVDDIPASGCSAPHGTSSWIHFPTRSSKSYTCLIYLCTTVVLILHSLASNVTRSLTNRTCI